MTLTSKEYYELSKEEHFCIKCGKPFMASRYKGTKTSYCGISCAKKIIEKRSCPTCGTVFDPPMDCQIYCSRDCVDHKKYKGSESKLHNRVETKCFVCGSSMMVIPYYVKNNMHKLCSKECVSIFQRERMLGEKSPFWNGGKYLDIYPSDFSKKLKNKIRERDGFHCQKCGIEQSLLVGSDGREYSLIIHHIDYNKHNCDELNLISLCRSCHAQTNFDRKDWENYYKELNGSRL